MKLRTYIVAVFIFFATIYSVNAQIKGNYATGEKRFEIDTANGMLNGRFRLWFKNGEKKFEGHFKDNQKHGTWTVWDTLHRVRVKYKFDGRGDYDFKIATFDNAEGKPIKRLNRIGFLQQRHMDSVRTPVRSYHQIRRQGKVIDSLIAPLKEPEEEKGKQVRTFYGYEDYTETRDSTGLINYPYVNDGDVLTSIKMYRFVQPSKNILLFYNTLLTKSIESYIRQGNDPELYTTSYFDKKISTEALQEKLKALQNIAGYKIEGIWYFDKRRMNSSTRILGICPVVFNEKLQKYEDVFWLYYPALREMLANKTLTVKGKPQIHTLEDILHYRQFSSFVYFREHVSEKEENIDIYKNREKLKQESAEVEVLPLMAEYVDLLHLTVAPLFKPIRLNFLE